MKMAEFKNGRHTFRLGQLDDMLSDIAEIRANAAPVNAYRARAVAYLQRGATIWNGGRTEDETIALCRDGDMPLARQADKIMAKLEDVLPPPTSRHTVINDVTGAFPDVPAMLAGFPLQMRRKVKRENEAAPVTIILNLGSIANVKAEAVLRRGIAVLALVRAVEAVRPVELWVGASSTDYSQPRGIKHAYFQIPTQPMDLARAAHLIAAPGMSRQLIYSILCDMGCGGKIPEPAGHKEAAKFLQDVRLGFPSVETFVAMPTLHNANVPELSDPAQWIKDHIQALSGADLEAEAA